MSAYGCAVCWSVVEPDSAGNVLVEGITDGRTRDWVWGPMLVHDDCRTRIRTPFDEQLGSGDFIAAWERVPFAVVVSGWSLAAAAREATAGRARGAA